VGDIMKNILVFFLDTV